MPQKDSAIFKMKTFISKSAEDTKKLGKKLAPLLCKGDVVALSGELGSGKTTFTKGIAEGLDVEGSKYVNSPSFVIAKEYNGKIPLYHLDLYRIKNDLAMETIGYEEYLWSDGICVIEWAEKILKLLPEEHIRIEFYFNDHNARRIKFVPKGAKYAKIPGKLK